MRTRTLVFAAFLPSLLCTDPPLAAQSADWVKFTSPQTQPLGRNLHQLVYDVYRQRVVMFGGLLFGGAYANDTWEFDGNNWYPMSPTQSPSGRYARMMAYDVARRRTVLFGGANSQGQYDDTWEYDGLTWTQKNPVHKPPARTGSAIAYDEARGRVVIFGGWNGNRMGDTWEWDGTDWRQFTGPAPSVRSDVDMAYDAGRRVIVLYGGYATYPAYSDTWEYDGASWTQRAPATVPGPLCDIAISYDRGRGKILMYGGARGQTDQRSNKTWEWDGTNWTDLTPALQNSPPGRWVSSMAYDEARGRMVLFSGIDNFALFPNDTWELVTQDVATYRRFGKGCASAGGTPSLAIENNGMPRIGQAFSLGLRNLPTGAANVPFFVIGASNTSAPPFTLPLDLVVLQMPGCTLYASLDLVVSVANQGGAGFLAFGVPNTTALLNQHLYVQGGVVDPSANLGGIAWSDAGDAKVGR